MAYVIPLALSTMSIIPNKLHKSLKLLNLHTNAYNRYTYYMPYNQKVFGTTVNKKCLVSGYSWEI